MAKYSTHRRAWNLSAALILTLACLATGAPGQTTAPAGDLTTGVVYDYLRLELQEK